MPTNPFEPPKEVNEQKRPARRGFFGKYNPRSTGRSVIVAACFGAVGGLVLGGVQFTTKGSPGGYLGSVAALVALIFVGAIAGAVVEWQVR